MILGSRGMRVLEKPESPSQTPSEHLLAMCTEGPTIESMALHKVGTNAAFG